MIIDLDSHLREGYFICFFNELVVEAGRGPTSGAGHAP